MRYWISILAGICVILSSYQGHAQPPNDCAFAVPVCNSEELDYNSNGPGSDDFASGANSEGCLNGLEHQSAWFQIFIAPSSPPGATLAFTLNPNGGSGEDYDFALYGPNVECNGLGSPIRCSWADDGCTFCPQTGMGMGATDHSEGAIGDGFVSTLETQPGQSYYLLIDNYNASNEGFFLNWTGSAILSCECTAEVNIEGDLEICPGENTVLTATGTNLTDYSWEASGGGSISGSTTTASVTATSPGTYSVTVTDEESCTGETSVVVVEADGPEIEAEITPATCDQANGAIDVTVSGEGSPFSFNWSNGESTEDLTDVEAGNYVITVSGANGCSNTASFTVENENIPLEINEEIEPNTSCNEDNGSITISVNPPGSYTINWSNGESTQEIIDLGGGTYSVTVSGTGSCTETATFTVPDEPDAPQITAGPTPSTCDLSNGSIDVTVTGGVSPYTFNWSDGSTTEDLEDIPSGDYTVTVTGDNGCTAQQTITVPNNNPPINIDATVVANTACDAANGSITLSVTPSGSYTYSWSNGESTTNLDGLEAGSYTVTVTGSGSCSETATFTVPEDLNKPQLTVETTPSTCELPNGDIDLTITGGVAPYVINWSNGETTDDLFDVSSGSYEVTVTGDNSCSATLSVDLENENPPINITPSITPNTTCDGNNGSISVSVTPPGSYTFTWSNGETTQEIEELPPGTYSVTVDGDGNCDETATFTVPDQPNNPQITQTVAPANCGLNNGSIDVTVTGGVDPYSFSWSDGSTTEDLSDIPEGSYTVTVTGANECSDVATISVPDDPINFNIAQDISPNTSCLPEEYNGSITLAVTPTGSYTFNWSNGATTPEITDVEPGEYTVTVSAGGNCTETATFTIPDEPIEPQLSEEVEPTQCDLMNGEIDLTVSGGVPPFTFNWSDGSTSEDLDEVASGSYSVTVTGDNGCTATKSISVPNNDLLFAIAGTTTPNTSCTNSNGAVDITLTPEDPPYSFNWSNGATTEDIFNLDQGTYSVTVTYGACTQSSSFDVGEVIEEPQITPDVTPSTCNQSNGAIDLLISGGTSPYEFSWSNGTTDEDLTDIGPGIYSVTVTDANGCTSEADIQVQNNSSNFTLSGTEKHLMSCNYSDGSVDLSVFPSGDYSFSWSNGATTEDIDSLAPGDYSVTVTQDGNCSASAFFTIEDSTASPALESTVNPEYCGLDDGAISLTVIEGTAPYDFVWSNGDTSKNLVGVSNEDYTVTVTGRDGCTADEIITVPENNVTFSIEGSTVKDTSCTLNSGAVDIEINPQDTYSFVWSTGDTTEDLAGVGAGDYTVTVSAGGDCSSSREFSVTSDRADIEVNATPSDIFCFGDSTGGIEVSTAGGTAPYTYEWTPDISGNPQNPSDLPAGMYTVVATDANGCTGSAETTIEGPSSPLQLNCTVLSHVSKPGENDGAGEVDISGGTSLYDVHWSTGDSLKNVSAGSFENDSLGEGNYSVTVTDANGCSKICSFIVEVNECIATVGTMAAEVLSICGTGCQTAAYDDSEQNTGDGILQYILHTGSGGTIEGEIARNDAPTFCYDSTAMTFGTMYYISAVVGPGDGSGNVVLQDVCTKIAPGTPIVFYQKPLFSLSSPDTLKCNVQSTTISAIDSLSGASFSWTTNDGNIAGSDDQPIVEVDQAGTYVLEVTNNGCTAVDSVSVIDISNEINAEITANPGDTIDCTVSTISLTGSADGTSNEEFYWYSGGTLLSTDQIISTESSGDYELIVVDSITLCRDSTLFTIEESREFPTLKTDSVSPLSCKDTVVTLSGSSPDDSIQLSWATVNGSDTTVIGTGPTVDVEEPGTYYFIGIAPNGCQNTSTLSVGEEISLPSVEAGSNDTLDCQQTPLIITATVSDDLILKWKGPEEGIVSNTTEKSVTVEKPGQYILTGKDPLSHCRRSDTVEIYQSENIPRGTVSTLAPRCSGEGNGSIRVQNDPQNGPYEYIVNGQNYGAQNVISPLTPGSYSLVVRDAKGCTWTTEVEIPETEELIATLPENLIVSDGDSTEISVEVNVPSTQLDTIIWTPEEEFPCSLMPCLTHRIVPKEHLNVQVTVIDSNGCRASDAMKLIVKKSRDVFVPNVFSPNGDGTNDVFRIFGDDRIRQIVDFQIFNRWGDKVFENRNFPPNAAIHGWDGRYRGQRLKPAVFVWKATIEFEDGEELFFKGDVTLVR